MKNIYFKNSFVCLYYDTELRLGEAVWSGELQGAEFREAALLCLDLMDRYQLTRWLGDNRKMKPIGPADLKWTIDVFVPQLVQGPLLRMANLPSTYAEHRKAIDVLVQKVYMPSQQLIIREFSDKEEAMKWLFESSTPTDA